MRDAKRHDSSDYFLLRLQCLVFVLTSPAILPTLAKRIGKPRQTNGVALRRGRGPTANRITFTANQIIKGEIHLCKIDTLS